MKLMITCRMMRNMIVETNIFLSTKDSKPQAAAAKTNTFIIYRLIAKSLTYGKKVSSSTKNLCAGCTALIEKKEQFPKYFKE